METQSYPTYVKKKQNITWTKTEKGRHGRRNYAKLDYNNRAKASKEKGKKRKNKVVYIGLLLPLYQF